MNDWAAVVPKSLEAGRADGEGGERGLPLRGFIRWDEDETNPHTCPGTARVWAAIHCSHLNTHTCTHSYAKAGALVSASFWIHTSPVTLSFLLTEQMPALLWLKLLSQGFHQRLLPPLSLPCPSLLSSNFSAISRSCITRGCMVLQENMEELKGTKTLVVDVMWAQGGDTHAVRGGQHFNMLICKICVCKNYLKHVFRDKAVGTSEVMFVSTPQNKKGILNLGFQPNNKSNNK